MFIEVECRGCGAKYRVRQELAGKMAQCKHCNRKFRVPMQSAVTLDDDVAVEAAPPRQAPVKPAPARPRVQAPPQPEVEIETEEERTFEEYGLDEKDRPRRPKDYEPKNEPLFPPLVAELWLPLGVTIVCYGIALWVAISRMLGSYAPLSGLILVAVTVLLFLAAVIPITIRGIDGAGGALDFKLPNSVWLQTVAAIAPPTLGLVLGFFFSGAFGAIAFGAVGLLLTIPLMLVMYGISPLQAVQAALLAGLMYALSMGATAGVLAALGLFFFPLWHLNVPWEQPKPKEVATATTAPAPVVVEAPVVTPTTAPAPVVVAPTTAPVIEAPKPVVPQVIWTARVDPPLQPNKWPPTAQYMIDVKPPVRVITTTPPGPFVTLVDSDSVDTYDLRSGRRIGTMRDRLRNDAMLSPGGSYLIARSGAVAGAPAHGLGGGPAALPAGPGAHFSAGEVYSTIEGRLLTKLNANPAGSGKMLGFAGDERVLISAYAAGKPVVNVIDVPSGQLIRAFDAEVNGIAATSPGGRLLAVIGRDAAMTAAHRAVGAAAGPTLALKLYDTDKGEVVGLTPLPGDVGLVRSMAFSPAGTSLAAMTIASAGPTRLIVWDIATGKQTQDLAVPEASLGRASANFQWMPDEQGFIVFDRMMLDRTSGKPFGSIIAPPIAGSSGRLHTAFSNYALLCEYLPAGTSERVIYRTVTMPKVEIDKVLASLRGQTWKPGDADAALAAAAARTPTTGAATAPADGLAAAAPKMSLKDVAALKQWIVTVVVVRKTDIVAMDEQIKAEQQKLPEIDRRWNQAKQYADRLAGEYTTVYDRNGRPQRQNRYSEREIGEARVAQDRINDERRKAKALIARLEREKKEADLQRTVVGKLDDGTPVQIDVEGAALIAIVDSMIGGSRWNVAGIGRVENNVIRIKPRTLTVAE